METVQKAELLQAYLVRIGGPISIVTAISGTGIKVGTYAEWLPHLSTADYLVNNPHDYVLLTRGGALRIVAKDQMSLERAIFRYLEILGYRQFFPTSTWEELPTARTFNADIGIQEKSVIDNETMIGGAGSANLELTKTLLDSWRQKNRITPLLSMTDYQMWMNQVILYSDYKDEFAAHDAYWSEDGGYKLCVMEPRVRQIVAERVKKHFDTNPDALAWTVTATDGSVGWHDPCENGHPVAQGGTGENAMSPTDRQVALANYVREQGCDRAAASR